MSQPLDVTYVELRARGEDKTARDIIKALKDIQRAVDNATKEIEKDLQETTREFERELTDAGDVLTKEAERQRAEWKKTGESMGAAIVEASENSSRGVKNFADDAVRDLRKVETSAARAAAAIGASAGVGGNDGGVSSGGGGGGGGDGVDVDFGRDRNALSFSLLIRRALASIKAAVSDMVSSLTEGLGDALKQLGQFGSSVASVFGSIGSVIAAAAFPALLIALVPVVFALAGALGQLLGVLLLLPGAIAALVAIFAPLIVAFQGFGTALAALSSGDLDKINEAMKNLAPAARAVAVEMHGLAKPLKDIRMLVQESFFRPLIGDFKELGENLFPTLRTGLASVAGSLGNFASELLELLGTSDVVETIGAVFASASRIVDSISPQLIGFFDTLFAVIERSLPFVERMFAAFGRGIDSFSGWLDAALQTGEFEEMLEGAFDILKSLGGLIASTGRLLGALFGDFGDDGQNFIDMLAEMFDGITEFLNSAEGQNILDMIASSIPAVVAAMKLFLGIIGGVLLALAYFQDAIVGIINFGSDAGVVMRDFFSAIGDGARSAWDAVTGFFSSVGDFFGDIGGWVADTWPVIMQFFTDIGSWFSELPGKILEFLQGLPETVATIFTDMLSRAGYAVGYGIGLIVAAFVGLPMLVWNALQELRTFITETFTGVRDYMTETTSSAWTNVTMFFSTLPETVLAFLLQLVANVRRIFNETRDTASSTASSLVERVVGFFRSLPGRIMEFVNTIPGRVRSVFNSLKDSAVSIGRGIVDGIINGIRNGASSAINVARDVAGQILRGFKDALGIASPSKRAALEIGAPIVQGVDAGMHAESRALTSSINSAVDGVIGAGATAAGSGGAGTMITFDTGAVQVIFSGVVPTEAEARRTGEAVGTGIAQTLAQRDVRTAVRMI
jgi:hypothetical protein